VAQADSPDSHYPDAHYNLAFVCEKLGADAEAQQHWEAYVRLDPADSRVPQVLGYLIACIQVKLGDGQLRSWRTGPREFMFSIYGGRGGLRTGSLLLVAKGLNE
jgi:hypothetical protein